MQNMNRGPNCNLFLQRWGSNIFIARQPNSEIHVIFFLTTQLEGNDKTPVLAKELVAQILKLPAQLLK